MRVCVDHSRHHEPVLQVHEPGVLGGVLQSFLVRPHEDDSVTLRDQRLRPGPIFILGIDSTVHVRRLGCGGLRQHRIVLQVRTTVCQREGSQHGHQGARSRLHRVSLCNPRQRRGSRRPPCRIHPYHHYLRRQATVGCAARLLQSAWLPPAGLLRDGVQSGKHSRRCSRYHRIAAVAHGFRSSFRDWTAEETDHPREVIETALAHVSANETQ